MKNIGQFNYDNKYFWSPELFLVNALSSREEIRYKLQVVPKHRHLFEDLRILDLENPSAFVENLTVLVTEQRKIRGVFYERLELNEFPIDLQEVYS